MSQRLQKAKKHWLKSGETADTTWIQKQAENKSINLSSGIIMHLNLIFITAQQDFRKQIYYFHAAKETQHRTHSLTHCTAFSPCGKFPDVKMYNHYPEHINNVNFPMVNQNQLTTTKKKSQAKDIIHFE